MMACLYIKYLVELSATAYIILNSIDPRYTPNRQRHRKVGYVRAHACFSLLIIFLSLLLLRLYFFILVPI